MSDGVLTPKPMSIATSASRRFLRKYVDLLLVPLIVPLARGYIRYAPFAKGKGLLYTIMDYRLSQRTLKFTASTIFGRKISGDTKDIIQRYIYYFGIWEPNLTRWLTELLKPGDVFVDVGANIGYYSLLASKLVGDTGAVVAIEASPTIFKQLRANLGLNRANNVRAVNIAAAGAKKAVNLFHGPESNIGRTTILETAGFEFECEIQAAPLNEILQLHEIQKLRAVKIDVEGAEWEVLQGLTPLLADSSRIEPIIIAEIEPDRLARQGKAPEDALRLLSRFGFHAYCLENDYSARAYLPPHVEKRPQRIEGDIRSETLVVFSRQDTKVL